MFARTTQEILKSEQFKLPRIIGIRMRNFSFLTIAKSDGVHKALVLNATSAIRGAKPPGASMGKSGVGWIHSG